MRILLATFWAIPHLGGVWNYMQQLKKSLETFGHEVDLLGYGSDMKSVRLFNETLGLSKQANIEELPFNLNNPHIDRTVHYYSNKIYEYEQALSQFDLSRYDVIHTQDVFSTVIFKIVRQKKTALVATLHGSVAKEIQEAHYKQDRDSAGNKYFHELEYEGATAAEYTIVANQWLKQILTAELSVPAEKITVLHYGYDIEKFVERMHIKSTIKKMPNKKLIIYTGRLSEYKGVHYLIAALQQVKLHRADWLCWIVGDGPKKNELERQCQTLGLQDDIIFLGQRDDVPYLLSLSDILVLPTLIENQPLSIIEAQLAGKAVLASSVGGVPEMIEHGVTGILLPPGNSQILAEQIMRLLEDEHYRKRLGKQAQAFAYQHWDLTKASKKVEIIYKQALQHMKT